MGQVITEEIDLRPTWRRWTNTHPSPGRIDPRPNVRVPLPRTESELGFRPLPKPNGARKLLVFGGAGALLVVLAIAASGSSEPDDGPAKKRPAKKSATQVAAASVVGDARSASDALASARPIRDDAPIVIHATPEQVEPATSEKRPSRAPVDTRGKIAFTSDPEVTIFEGSTKLGTTPFTAHLAAGPHDLRFVSRALHLEEKRRIDVRAGKTEDRELAFALGWLRVIAPEGAKLSLNGRAIGAAPFSKLRLAEGRHHLQLEHEGHTLDEWIEVPSGHQVEYRARFED